MCSGEGSDYGELSDDDQHALGASITLEFNIAIFVIDTVGACAMDAWIENENVTAVVYTGLLS